MGSLALEWSTALRLQIQVEKGDTLLVVVVLAFFPRFREFWETVRQCIPRLRFFLFFFSFFFLF